MRSSGAGVAKTGFIRSYGPVLMGGDLSCWARPRTRSSTGRLRSRALLDRLLEWSTQPQYVYRHRWQPGDLVVWNNTGMLHRATEFEPSSRRVMHRTTLSGERPPH
jgi:hypothetical protein